MDLGATPLRELVDRAIHDAAESIKENFRSRLALEDGHDFWLGGEDLDRATEFCGEALAKEFEKWERSKPDEYYGLLRKVFSQLRKDRAEEILSEELSAVLDARLEALGDTAWQPPH